MSETFDSWAIVELMGHVKMAGRLTEEERFGSKLGRLDIPGHDGAWSAVYFNGASVYRLTPCTEEAARIVAKRAQPEPVHQWEIPKQIEVSPSRKRELDDDPEDARDADLEDDDDERIEF